jgi:protein-tyrosine phosphatase
MRQVLLWGIKLCLRAYFIFDNILVVCVGNICRSPTAERIFQQKMPTKIISSAGLQALVGHDMDQRAASLLKVNGYDTRQHVARKLNRELVVEADLILVMENDHQGLLMKQYPEASGKILLLGKWQGGIDIPDPYRKSNEVFSHVFNQVEKNTISWCERLASQES